MNLKLHIVGVSMLVVLAMIALIVTGRVHFGEPAAPPPVDVGDDFIRIDSASWGLNCTAYPQAKKVGLGELSPLRTNNVLRRVSALCNGRQRCALNADEATLGMKPLAGTCLMQLEVDFRCATFDHIRHASPNRSTTSGTGATLDCDPDTRDKPPPAPKPVAPIPGDVTAPGADAVPTDVAPALPPR